MEGDGLRVDEVDDVEDVDEDDGVGLDGMES